MKIKNLFDQNNEKVVLNNQEMSRITGGLPQFCNICCRNIDDDSKLEVKSENEKAVSFNH